MKKFQDLVFLEQDELAFESAMRDGNIIGSEQGRLMKRKWREIITF